MNLIVIIPAIVVLLFVIIYASRHRTRPSSGLGNREDSTEPPELRGDTQWKNRSH
jgi:hypothetical protein